MVALPLLFPLALALGTSAATGAGSAQCRVKSRAGHISTVTVHPAGEKPFDVKLTGVPMSVAPPTKVGAPTPVHVRAPIEFDGEAAHVGYVARWAVSTSNGLVHLGRGTVVDRVRAQSGHLVGNVVFEQHRDKNQHVSDEVYVADLSLSCASLDIDERQASASIAFRKNARYFQPRVGALTFFQWPGAGQKVVLHVAHSSSVILSLLAERRTQLRLELRYDDGSKVVGWVHRSTVKETGAMGSIAGSGGGSGCGVARDFIGGAGSYEGPVVVRPGARIFSGPGKGEWARVPRGRPLHVRVFHNRGNAYAEILELKGIADLCDLMERAYVGRDDVQFPRSAGPR